jgi:hypothetical protein
MASLITNLFIRVHGKKGAKLTEVKSFLLDWSGSMKQMEEGKPQQSTEDIKKTLLQIAKDQNKRVIVQSKPPRRKAK